MSDDVEKVRDQIDLVEVIKEYTPLQQVGRNFKGVCPFHEEKTPSFFVRPDNGLWYCFGCQRGGDVFSFLMEKENIVFPEALQILAKRAGITLSGRKDVKFNEEKERMYQIMLDALEFYMTQLNKDSSEDARLYIKKRKMSQGIVEKFQIGYAPDSWDAGVRFFRQAGYSQKEIIDAGLAIKSSKNEKVYDRFRNRVMFPIHDHLGRVVGFSGRTLTTDNEKEAKYINSPETLIYKKGDVLFGYYFANRDILRKGFAILVEGNIDVVSLADARIPYVVAPLGTGLTENQLKLLKRVTEKLLIVFDTDDAGKKAAEKAVYLGLEQNFDVKVATLSQGKDPDEAIKEDRNVFAHDLSNATPGFDYILSLEQEKSQGTQAHTKSHIAGQMFRLIQMTKENIIRESYFEKLARTIDMPMQSIKKDYVSWAKDHGLEPGLAVQGGQTRRQYQKTQVQRSVKSKTQLLEEYIVALLFNLPDMLLRDELVVEELSKLRPDAFGDNLLMEMVAAFLEEIRVDSEAPVNLNQMLDARSKEESERLHLIILKDFGTVMSSNEAFVQELRQVRRSMLKTYFQDQLQSLLKEKRETTEPTELERIHDKIREITKDLRSLQH